MRNFRIGTLIVLATLLVMGSVAPATALSVGDKAPDFTLPATLKEKLVLSDLVGKKNILLFGFIGAFTPT